MKWHNHDGNSILFDSAANMMAEVWSEGGQWHYYVYKPNKKHKAKTQNEAKTQCENIMIDHHESMIIDLKAVQEERGAK